MKRFLVFSLFTLILFTLSLSAHAQTAAKQHPPLVVGPVALNCVDKPCSSATVTADALGSEIGRAHV